MRRLILSRYILREHIGPFALSLALITLIFLLDLVFRHLSRILSKGLPLMVVFEFFGLNMAWIIATAVPMAVLTATLMAFGRLAADQEITAMQACGMSLRRLVMPVLAASAVLAMALIWFNNNILPDFNYRARTLADDITRKKPGVKIESGVWFNDLPNYHLLVKALDDSIIFAELRDIVIEDNTDANLQRTISAHSGRLEPRPKEGMLFLTLFNGEIQEINTKKLEEFRRLKFVKHALTLKAEDGMFWQRREPALRSDREKSVAQMRQEAEASQVTIEFLMQRINLLAGINFYHHFGRTFDLVPDTLAHLLLSPQPNLSLFWQYKLRLSQMEEWLATLRQNEDDIQSLAVEIHKKYAIPVAGVVFILIGAPLGVLARRGELATGAGLSLGFFLLYWAFLIGGEDLADRHIVSPFVSMWSANILIGSFGIYLFRRVAAGRFTPLTLRLTNWFRRFSFRDFIGKFSRRPDKTLEATITWREQPLLETAPDLFLPSQIEPLARPNPEIESPVPIAPPTNTPLLSWPQLEFTPVPAILRSLVERAHADWVVFADRNGTPLVYYENPLSFLPIRLDVEMMAKLAAGQIAATQEICRSIGEEGYFHFLFQEGEQRNIFIFQISPDFILLALVDRKIAIGLVRIHLREAAESLGRVIGQI